MKIFNYFRFRRYDTIVILIICLIFFSVVSGFFISEKSAAEKFTGPIVGAVSGVVGGGVLGWLAGGLGIALGGTAIGISAPVVILAGAIGGAIIGLGGGSAFTLMLLNPSDYNVNWTGVALSAGLSIGFFFLLKWTFKAVLSRFRDRK